MCYSSLNNRTQSSATAYHNFSREHDGDRTQANAVLYALRQNKNGNTVDQLRGVIQNVTNSASWVPTPSIRRAIGAVRQMGYNIEVNGGVYRLAF